ncbi:hypothetical protein [Amycolatopsis sp. NPDC059657]|uniref:hypothetical protein n=1 Tax=Amycolatopsis sp. NPDC059657 TaxID=3346899 RepID=UPI00366A627F
MTPQPLCVNDDTPATFAVVHTALWGIRVGPYLCESCATCTEPSCGEPSTGLDTDGSEPWCDEHAAAQRVSSGMVGPDLWALDSEDYRDLIAEARP